MGIFSKFKERVGSFSKWREVGEYKSQFSGFGMNAYRSEIVRSCIRPLADFTAKAECKSSDKRLERLINERPNMYMNGKEFLGKVRTLYELKNNVFIFIDRDERGRVTQLFPVNYSSFQALEYRNGLFIQFQFNDGSHKTIAWEDLAVLRKDYADSSIVGEDNTAILSTLEMITVSNQGIANAVKATANLRGILKSTKAMLAPEDIKKNKEAFVRDYLNLENEGGIASLDATQEFTPISMSPVVTTYQQMKEFRENVYRYFGVNENIVTSNMGSEMTETFYECKIESFLCDLSTELTSKVFTERERGFGNYIVFQANKLQFTSINKKIQMFSSVVLYGGMTVNEWRAGCNLPPIEGGDELIRRLDAAPVDEQPDEDEPDEEAPAQEPEEGEENGEG